MTFTLGLADGCETGGLVAAGVVVSDSGASGTGIEIGVAHFGHLTVLPNSLADAFNLAAQPGHLTFMSCAQLEVEENKLSLIKALSRVKLQPVMGAELRFDRNQTQKSIVEVGRAGKKHSRHGDDYA